MPDRIITGGQSLVHNYSPDAVIVLVIGFCSLEFICNLVLVIWDFRALCDLLT
jgi:hypothetical protein